MELLERLQAALQERYLVESVLGSGGTATVFSASDRNTGASVALKVLRPELAAALGTARFLHEIAIARSLTHPNIVAVYDWGKYANTYFMAMEYVQGRTLADILRANGHVNSVQAAAPCASSTPMIAQSPAP